MKITVITPYDSSNHGAYLQAYCLKFQLEKMGHEVYHVPTRTPEYVRNLYYKDKPVSKRDKVFPMAFRKKNEYGKRKYKIFTDVQKVFKVIDPDNDPAQLHILGSDEIWNITLPAFRQLTFWGTKYDKVITYAASIGKADNEKFAQLPEHVNAVRKISRCLVRDKRTADFVEKYTGREAQIVCDPTMLVPIEEYGDDFIDPFVENNDCLLIYAYKVSKAEKKCIRKYADIHHLKIVSCCFLHNWCDHQCECSPLQFSALIRKCKAVITTTFHGSIFSILNHANFVSIPTSPKTNQLLEQFGILDRLLPENQMSVQTLEHILNGSAIDYVTVDEDILKIRNRSVALLNEAIEEAASSEAPFSYQICPSDDCTGCFACMNRCPKDAISCVTDDLGRTLPQISPDKCVSCGLCKKVCPQVNAVPFRVPITCYAAQRNDDKKRIKSASGGIGAVLAEEIINAGGVVYGSAVKDGKVIHMRAETFEEVELFRGSKYVQSYIGNCFKDVQEQLKSGKKVLFIGTPCQIAGLKSFLGKECANLFCVDLICHGTPPMKYLEQHLNHKAGTSDADYITFRCGENDYHLIAVKNGKIIYKKDKLHDSYYSSFYSGLISRENCYSCTYSKQERVSDMTIGDFWGLNRSTLKTKQNGNISVILVNSVKGSRLFDSIKSELVFEERTVNEAVDGNPQLRRPSIKAANRTKFIRGYIKSGDFAKAVSESGILLKMLKVNVKHTPKSILTKIKKKIRK